MKRIFLIFLCLIMSLSLCVIGGCTDKEAVSGDPTNKIEVNAEEEIFLDIPSELIGTTVKYASWGSGGSDKTVAFENATGMKFEHVLVPQGDYITKIIGLIAADQAPDVIIENGDFPRTLNVVQPLTVETTGIDVTDPFWDQNFVKLYTIGKYCYLINSSKAATGVGACTYYNKTVFEENGIKSPEDYVKENNWNLDTLIIAMQQIRERADLDPGSYLNATVFMDIFGAHETPWDSDSDTFTNGVKSPEMKAALDWLVEQRDKDLCDLMLEGSHVSLTNGTGALQVAGAYGLRSYPGWFYEMDVNDLGFTYLPKKNKTDENYPFTASAGAYGICQGAKNPMGGGYYLRYMLNPDFDTSEDGYKNEEAKALYEELSANADYSKTNFNRGVRLCFNPELTKLTDGFLGQLIWTSQAQIGVKIESVNNTVDAAVAKANALIQEVINAQ